MGLIFHRRGFANNSSSTHSIIQLGDSDFNSLSDDYSNSTFGWDEFVLKSPYAKTLYILTLYRMQSAGWGTPEYIKNGAASYIVQNIASEIISDPRDLSQLQIDMNEYEIDHQSVFKFPYDHTEVEYSNGKIDTQELPSEAFILDFIKYIHKENFVIFGGNDNDDTRVSDSYNDVSDHWFKDVIGFLEKSHSGSTCVYDEDNKSWTLYNKNRGSELCFSFEGEQSKVSSIPTLIDLKITDYCEHGCYHCYQNSSNKGEHGNLSNLTEITRNLKNIGTGTVAIGGGNPLLYPKIKELVRQMSTEVTTCLTCNNIRTEQEFDTLRSIITNVDSIAITCNEHYSVSIVTAPFITAKSLTKAKTELYVQGILEMFTSEDSFRNYLNAVSQTSITSVTLLGYKPVGRAQGKAKKNVDFDWISICKEFKLNIGIDADITKRYSDLIAQHEIDTVYLTKEGNRSMFIDGVTLRAYPDSYSDHEGVSLVENKHKSISSTVIKYIYNGFKK